MIWRFTFQKIIGKHLITQKKCIRLNCEHNGPLFLSLQFLELNRLIRFQTFKASISMDVYRYNQGLSSCQLPHKPLYTVVTLITFKIPDISKQDEFSKL